MLYLVALPEVAYISNATETITRWYPPEGKFFKFQVIEASDNTTFDVLKEKLTISDTPVQLTKDEINYYKNQYGR